MPVRVHNWASRKTDTDTDEAVVLVLVQWKNNPSSRDVILRFARQSVQKVHWSNGELHCSPLQLSLPTSPPRSPRHNMEVDPQAPPSESAPHTGTSLINTDAAPIPPTSAPVPTTSGPAEPSSSTGVKRPHDRPEPSAPLLPMEEVLRRRLTVIQEGDNVLLRLPSDSIKAVVASKQG
jgi:hypothetical protein